ncbi:hypothetical protein BKA65DRAFT_202346 [Rhexocercosporidium sp. MPI-PUGE-AT-0058]|nr:hypothetical protein BKA65DRAFT_202346 [Rhexocercosporidium sp. MPI-PUGE-AT-0058]
MSPATVECERCRDGDLHNHWDHRTKETFQSIYDSVKSLAENKPRDHGRDVQTCLTELRGAMRELLTKHVERAIDRQIVKTKAIFKGSTLFPHYGDPDAPNYFRWAFNGNYSGFPETKMSSWSQSTILRCFKALESHELYIEDLEKAPVLDEPRLQLVRAANDAFTQYISENTGNHVNDLQKCLVGDGSAGLKGWKWDFEWFEEFKKFPYQRLLWKWSDKDLITSMEVLKNGSLKLVQNERSSSSSASSETTVKKETNATNAARRRGKTMVLDSDDEDDEEDEPYDDDEHDDDFDSGSTVIVDEGSSSGEFDCYLPMTRQLLKCPARLAKLELKVSELQTSNNTLRNSNTDLRIKFEETETQLKFAHLNNGVLLKTLEKERIELGELKTKCDCLERQNEELSRKCAASEQPREKSETDASIIIDKAVIVSEGCAAFTNHFKQQNKQHRKSDRAYVTEMRGSIERSHSLALEASNSPTKVPGHAGHQESPRKNHARPANTQAVPKISKFLGVHARNRHLQPSPSKQSPARPTRPALGPKPNNALVSKFNCPTPSNSGREGTGTNAKTSPTAQGSENIARGTEWLGKESPDCKIVRSRLADDQGGQTFSFKRERSDDEKLQTASKKARN